MITHILWLYLALFTAQPTIRADPEPPADRAAPRADANSFIAHGELLAKKTQGRIDVYFLGDSIVRRWGATDYPQLLASWKANFFGWNAANFGWGADRIEHVLWRLENGELDDVHPKVIVIQAVANNVGNTPGDESKIENVRRGVQALVDTCRRKAPNATIIVTAIFPRNDNIGVVPEINRINEHIAQLAAQSGIRFLNINSQLADANGRLHPGLMNANGLHPSERGYQVWADALKPLLTEILGPPAQQDLAPPPTGDPSARHKR